MSIKVEEDAILFDTGIVLITLSGKDKMGFKQEDNRVLVYVKPRQRMYVNHRLYHNPTDLQVKMELTE